MDVTGRRRVITVWAVATVLGLGVSAGLCPAGERRGSRSATPRPSATAKAPNLQQLIVKALGGARRTSPTRARPTAAGTGKPSPRGRGHAQLQKQLAAALARAKTSQNGPQGATGERVALGKLLTSALAGAQGSGQKVDLARVQKLLNAMLSGKGAKDGAIDTAALQKQLAAALAGAGGRAEHGGSVDLAAIQKLVAGMLTGALGQPSRPKAGLPPGMSGVLMGRAQAAMDGGNFSDARGIIERVMTNASQGDPAFGQALRMSVRMETVTSNLVKRAEQAGRSGNHVARASALMKLGAACGDTDTGRRARAWLASARKDPALAGAVREARARQVVADLGRAARSARRAAPQQGDGLIVTDTSRHRPPLIDDLANMSPARRKALLAEARSRLADVDQTPTARRILGQLTDLETGTPPRRSPAAERSRSRNHVVSLD